MQARWVVKLPGLGDAGVHHGGGATRGSIQEATIMLLADGVNQRCQSAGVE